MKKTLILSITLLSTALNATEWIPALDHKNSAAYLKQFSEKNQISIDTLTPLFAQVKIKKSVKKASKKSNQAEFKSYWEDYRDRMLSTWRIKNGKAFLITHKSLLDDIEYHYGVDREVITAIIGMESNYGKNIGSHRAIDAISTMVFESRPKSSFYRKQLDSFLLRCLKQDDCLTTPSSWAGAQGLGQFIPTSIDSFAVDHNKDSRIDMTQPEDAIASVANYLKKHKWRKADFIAYQVNTLDNRHKELLTGKLTLNTTVEKLRQVDIQGIGNIRGSKNAKLFEMDTRQGKQVFVGYRNFKAITHYNRSHKYALAVTLLSQRLKK
jgi:membrane-bound lytic murein transglycosylase B